MSKKDKVKKGQFGESPFKATVCSFCEHSYIFPCNGERYDCANAVWKRSKGRVDVGRLTEEERAKLAKTGKIPDVDTNKRKPLHVVLLELKKRKKDKVKKKRRVRL